MFYRSRASRLGLWYHPEIIPGISPWLIGSIPEYCPGDPWDHGTRNYLRRSSWEFGELLNTLFIRFGIPSKASVFANPPTFPLS